MSSWKRFALPLLVGLLGSVGLAILYFGLVTWAESFEHAVQLFWEDRAIVLPIILGFGVQLGLYTVLQKRLFVPIQATGASGAITGASGGISAVAMVACCAHHVTDVLPLVGLTAAATFLAEYRLAFMLLGLGTTIAGIVVMLGILLRERRKAIMAWSAAMEAS
jgi:hypothetical protein